MQIVGVQAGEVGSTGRLANNVDHGRRIRGLASSQLHLNIKYCQTGLMQINISTRREPTLTSFAQELCVPFVTGFVR